MIRGFRQQAFQQLEAERKRFADQFDVVILGEYRITRSEHVAKGVDGNHTYRAAATQGENGCKDQDAYIAMRHIVSE